MLGVLGQPYGYLWICRWFLKDREEADIAHIAEVLGVQSDPREAPDVPWRTNTFGVWMISTEGRIQSSSIRPHVRWLLETVGGYMALEPLQADGKYQLSVFFFDLTPPDPAERRSVTEELERHGISFDFELERDDFP
jgi:hypothetical protein